MSTNETTDDTAAGLAKRHNWTIRYNPNSIYRRFVLLGNRGHCIDEFRTLEQCKTWILDNATEQ